MRLDSYLVKKGLFDSRTKAKQAIERGEIFINSKMLNKPSQHIDENENYNIEHVYQNQFVSLGGFKLKKALTDFRFDCNGLTVADIGASTGGFTDCLLKSGVKKVYAVDLNDSLLHQSLKNDDRVISVIKNAKDLVQSDFGDDLDLIVADLSFISITLVIEIFAKLLKMGKNLILLIKPQFEVGSKRRYKNGIIRDEKVRARACEEVYNCAVYYGFAPVAFTTAPIVEGKNIEYLMLFEKGGKPKFDLKELHKS